MGPDSAFSRLGMEPAQIVGGKISRGPQNKPRSHWSNSDPNSVDLGDDVKIWGDFDQSVASLATSGATSSNLGRLRPIPSRIRPSLGVFSEFWRGIDRIRANLVNSVAMFGHLWASLAYVGPIFGRRAD